MQGNTPVECEILNVIQGAGIWPDCDDKTQLLQAIETLITGGGSGGGIVTGSEIGAVSAFAMPTPPTGWLVCDGSAISRTEYADLFATIGTVWGAGDETSTFNLPDLRGEFVRGFDDGRGVDAGRVFGSSQADEFKEHFHQVGILREVGQAGNNLSIHRSSGSAIDQTETAGGVETRPRNIAMTYAIKAFYPSAS
ncbi:phage tail protein [Thalassospira australica]|uniref:phage tail protein n=1 Tax=Thalassospira australica TaxID=1528106 RepID=UPI00051A599C|nr:phage tail protein [Thalassospira australica]